MTDTTSSALDLNAWKASLTRWADGLDLGTDHGWDVFLRRVQDNTMATRLTLLQEVSRVLTGENDVPTTRGGTVRRIAYAWVLHGVGPVLRPSRPVGGDRPTRATVAAEVRGFTAELRAAADRFDDRADTIENGDAR